LPPPPEFPVTAESLQRKRLLCGPNSLYLLLKLHGCSVRYADVKKEVLLSEDGVSMLQLRNAAKRWGLPAAVRRCQTTEEDLSGCSLPLIAHINKDAIIRPEGHYVVVVQVIPDGDKRGVRVIDGTSGKLIRYDWDHFLHYWDGYILEPYVTSWGEWLTAGTLSLLATLGVMALWGKCAARRTATAHTGRILLVVCLGWFFQPSTLSPALATGGISSGMSGREMWRTADADGVNCLYLQLRLLGHSVDYASVRKVIHPEGGGTSLSKLK
jgi:hypothetical protein